MSRLVVVILASIAASPATAALPPLASAALREVVAALPEARRVDRDHFVVLSTASGKWSNEQADRLEQVFQSFTRFTKRLGLDGWRLRHKLVCVLFDDRAAFDEFARTHDGLGKSWHVGYYSLPHDRTVLYRGSADRDADPYADARTIATTTHETVHQILYHSGLFNPYVQYPLWCVEGLATSFETDDTDRLFGPEVPFGPRQQRFLGLVENGRLMNLTTFLALDRMPDGRPATVQTVYNQSYGLVEWLARRHTDALARYVRLMQHEPRGRPSADRHRRLFEQAFGSIESLEQAWRLDAARSPQRDRRP